MQRVGCDGQAERPTGPLTLGSVSLPHAGDFDQALIDRAVIQALRLPMCGHRLAGRPPVFSSLRPRQVLCRACYEEANDDPGIATCFSCDCPALKRETRTGLLVAVPQVGLFLHLILCQACGLLSSASAKLTN